MEQKVKNRLGVLVCQTSGTDYEEKGIRHYEKKDNLQRIGNLADHRCTADELRRHHRTALC